MITRRGLFAGLAGLVAAPVAAEVPVVRRYGGIEAALDGQPPTLGEWLDLHEGVFHKGMRKIINFRRLPLLNERWALWIKDDGTTERVELRDIEDLNA